MADIERMMVVFPEPMAAQLRAAVDAGEYASTSEAVRDAVQLWSDRRSSQDDDVQALRRAWDDGMASGDAGPLDMTDVIREARTMGAAKPNG